jgi:hypothetical protein
MNTEKDREVIREPLDPAVGAREVEEAFQFNNCPSEKQLKKCAHLEQYARGLAFEIAAVVPQGKFQTVAINNLLGALMWARQGILAECDVQFSTTGPGPDAIPYVLSHPAEFTPEQLARAQACGLLHASDCAIHRGTLERPEPCSCGVTGNPVEKPSSGGGCCCERDHNKDGNCDVHRP